MSVQDLLKQYAVESGELVDENAEVDQTLLNEVMVDEVAAQGGESINTIIDQSDTAGDITEQLDDLADRAKEADEKHAEDSPAAEVAAESLYREYGTLMRAYKLSFPARSFESASGRSRLKALEEDARRLSTLVSGARKNLQDYSSEGALWSFLRRDKAKLESAKAALHSSRGPIATIGGELKDHPVTVNHDLHARFLTRGGQPVLDLKAAIQEESNYLQAAQKRVTEGLKLVADVGKLLDGQDPSMDVEKLMKHDLFTKIRDAQSSPGSLMGSYIIIKGSDQGQVPGLYVPKFTRKAVRELNGVAAATGAAAAYLAAGAIGVAIGGAAIGMLGLAGGMAALSGTVGKAVSLAGTVAAGAAAGKATYGAQADRTKIKSIATASDLAHAVDLVLAYDHILAFPTGEGLNFGEIDDVSARHSHRDAEFHKNLAAVTRTLNEAADHLIGLQHELYEQAFYTTTMMASLVQAIVKAAKH